MERSRTVLGIDVVYPITFGPLPTIPDDFLENENNLRLLDVTLCQEFLVIDAVKFLKDDEEMKDLGEKYGVPAFSPPSWRDGLNDAQILEAFVDAMQVAARDPTTGASKLAPLDPTVADSWLARTTNSDLLRDALEQMGPFNRFRFPGLSKIPGLFTSQQIQRLQKGNDTIDLAGTIAYHLARGRVVLQERPTLRRLFGQSKRALAHAVSGVRTSLLSM